MAADISRHTNGEAQMRISTHRCMRCKVGQLRGTGNAKRYHGTHSCTQSKDGRGEGPNSRLQAIGEKRRGYTCIYATVSPGAPLYSLIHKWNTETVTLPTTTRHILHTKKRDGDVAVRADTFATLTDISTHITGAAHACISQHHLLQSYYARRS